MNALLSAFTPNRSISINTLRLIAVTWFALLVAGWVVFPPAVVPRPFAVIDAFTNLANGGGLVQELIVSLWLNVEAIFYSTLISLALSYLTVLPGARPLVAFVSKLRFLGFTGLTFLFGLVVTGHELKLWMLVFGMSVFFVTSMASVVASIPKSNFDYARSLNMGEWRAVWEVVVLGTIDQAIETLRQNAAIGWMMLTMVEGLVRSEGGIGSLLLNENKHFKLEAVFAIQLTILAVGLLQDYLIGALKNALCPYASITLERK